MPLYVDTSLVPETERHRKIMSHLVNGKEVNDMRKVTTEMESARSGASSCCVSFIFEGEFRSKPGRWNEIEKRDDIEIAKRDEAYYRTWISESGWRDFRIVKVTTTREILPHNTPTPPPSA